MLRQAKQLKNYKLGARDGDIGRVKDFYFDDQIWTVRYLVADTGGWLSGRLVLISPYALDPPNDDTKISPVNLTKGQIENSPAIAADQPVSRHFEWDYYSYYGWPGYWGGSYAWGETPYPTPGLAHWSEEMRLTGGNDPHLRSMKEVSGYNAEALDGEIGHIDDFLIDDETRTIRYLAIDTRNWWPGKKVLVSPEWIQRVSWAEARVFINLNRGIIKSAPEYDEHRPITRDYETRLYRHYNREYYWASSAAST